MENLGQELKTAPGGTGTSSVVPVGNRRYIKTNRLTKEELVRAFKNSRIVE